MTSAHARDGIANPRNPWTGPCGVCCRILQAPWCFHQCGLCRRFLQTPCCSYQWGFASFARHQKWWMWGISGINAASPSQILDKSVTKRCIARSVRDQKWWILHASSVFVTKPKQNLKTRLPKPSVTSSAQHKRWWMWRASGANTVGPFLHLEMLVTKDVPQAVQDIWNNLLQDMIEAFNRRSKPKWKVAVSL